MINNKNLSAVKKLQQESFDVLNMPEVSNRLGSYASKLSGLLERTDAVGVEWDGFMDVDRTDLSSIPVVALTMGQRALLHADASGMTEGQRQALTRVHGEVWAQKMADGFASYLSRNQQHHEVSMFDSASHSALADANHSDYNDTHLVIGRPYVAMNMDSAVNGNLSPVVFLHELTHVMQKEATPMQEGILIERNKVRAELEAYCVAAQVIFGFMDAGRQRELLRYMPKTEVEYALEVERVRVEYQKTDDLFDPNDLMAKGLIDNGLGITRLLKDMIRQKEFADKPATKVDLLTH